ASDKRKLVDLDHREALTRLNARRSDVCAGIASPELPPAEIEKCEVEDPIGRLRGQPLAPMLARNPKATLGADLGVVRLKRDDADEVVWIFFETNRPREGIRRLLIRDGIEKNLRAVRRIGPGHLGAEILHDFPVREFGLHSRSIGQARLTQ